MGRGRGKGKKATVSSSHEDLGSEEVIPAQKRRGRPQKPLKEEASEEEAEKIEEQDGENTKAASAPGEEMKSSAAAENGKKRKRYMQAKENVDLVKEENGVVTTSITGVLMKPNGFRQNGSRRKNKPRRAAEAGVQCKYLLYTYLLGFAPATLHSLMQSSYLGGLFPTWPEKVNKKAKSGDTTPQLLSLFWN